MEKHTFLRIKLLLLSPAPNLHCPHGCHWAKKLGMAGIQKCKNATTLSYQNLTFLNFFIKHSFGCFMFFIRLQCFEKTDLSVSANLMVSSFYLLREATGETPPFSMISSFFLQIKFHRAQLLRLCHKRHWDVLVLSRSTRSKRSQLPDCEDSQTDLWGVSHGKLLRQLTTSHTSELPWNCSPCQAFRWL